MTMTTNLSGNDAAVLGALFDPEASLQNHARIDVRMQGPYDQPIVSKIKVQEKSALLPINTEQVTADQIEQAISSLDKIISDYPKYASAWNNRAQARKMLHEIDGSVTTSHLREVFADIGKAIELASPKNAVQMTSPDDAKVLASAHTHRGYHLWKSSRPEAALDMLSGIDGLDRLNKDQLEELASRDFSLGGKYGNQTAQQLAVKTNPYAKLCGSIVKEALQKEIKDFYGQPMLTTS